MMVVLITLWEIIIVIFIVPAVNLTHFRKSFFIFANHFFLNFCKAGLERKETRICNLQPCEAATHQPKAKSGKHYRYKSRGKIFANHITQKDIDLLRQQEKTYR